MKKIVIPVIALLLAACNSKTTETGTRDVPAGETVTEALPETAEQENVSVASVDATTAATNVANHTVFNGILIVPPQRHATVTLTMGGTVKSTTFLPGQYVKKGDVLATVENPEFIALQQTYLEAHAQTEFLEAEYHRQKTLSAQEAASQKRFQQSKADYLSMKSRLEATAARLLLLGVSTDRLLGNGITPYLEVKAPVSGYVSRSDVNLGKYVETGEPLCDVIDKGETLLRLTAYEKDLDSFIVGNPVVFRVNGMGEQTFHATIFSIGQEVDVVNRSLEVYARVKETNSRFRPGMYVTAQVEKK